MTDTSHHSESTNRRAANGADPGAPKPWVARPLPEALTPLIDRNNWCLWKWTPQENDKWTKVPYQLNGVKAKSNDSETWTTFDEVLGAFDTATFDGIGRFFDQNVIITAFDVDKCRDADTGLLHPWAQRLVERCNTYAEVTISGTGIRIIGTSAGGHIHTKKKVPDGDGISCEIYRKLLGRYIVVTGDHLDGTPNQLADITSVIDEVRKELDALNDRSSSDEDDNAATSDSDDRDAAELPPILASLLDLKDPDCGTYPSRSELVGGLCMAALLRNVSKRTIIAACSVERPGRTVYEHCRIQSGGAAAYLARQIKKASKKIREASQSEMMTDLGNARRLVRLHGNDLRYVAPWRCWMTWDEARWQKDDDGAIMRVAKATIEEMFTEASQMSDEARRTARRVFAIKSQSVQRLEAMVKLAKSEEPVVLAVDQVDADPMILGVKNGVVDLRTATFREARRDDYVTKIAGVAFDATATCPNWLKFLERIFPAGGDGKRQQELIAYVQRMTGYVLTGLTVEEILLVLWGSGNNGKSTFRETLFTLMGDYAVGSDASLLLTSKQIGGATPDVARLHGRRLVTINETPQHSRLNEARVKFLTSHDVTTARNLFQEPFDFTPTHKTFLTTNHKPIVHDTDEGIWRRLHLIPFITTFPKGERDRSFRENKLLPELSGILNWALEGLRAYLKSKNGLDPPEEVMDATKEYREDMDIVGRWIAERCIKGDAVEEKFAALYKDYKGWAEEGIGFVMSKLAFTRELVDNRGFRRTRGTGGVMVIRGLKIDPNAEM